MNCLPDFPEARPQSDPPKVFSPGGKALLTASVEGFARLFDVAWDIDDIGWLMVEQLIQNCEKDSCRLS